MTNLVTKEEALAYLEEPDDGGGEVDRAIADVSAAIVDLTGDRFSSEEREEFCDGDGEELVLKFAPVDLEEPFVITDRTTGEVVPATDYEVDGEAGLVRVASDGVPNGGEWECGVRRFKCEYTGGFDGVPKAVRHAALKLLARRYAMPVAGQTQESRGGVSRTISDAAFPPDVLQMLSQYIQEDGETG